MKKKAELFFLSITFLVSVIFFCVSPDTTEIKGMFPFNMNQEISPAAYVNYHGGFALLFFLTIHIWGISSRYRVAYFTFFLLTVASWIEFYLHYTTEYEFCGIKFTSHIIKLLIFLIVIIRSKEQ